MKTYSEPEIEAYVAKALSAMPWKDGRPPMSAANSARFIVLHVLKKNGIYLYDDGVMKNSRGHKIGTFATAEWKDGHIEWTYMSYGGGALVVCKILVGEQ